MQGLALPGIWAALALLCVVLTLIGYRRGAELLLRAIGCSFVLGGISFAITIALMALTMD